MLLTDSSNGTIGKSFALVYFVAIPIYSSHRRRHGETSSWWSVWRVKLSLSSVWPRSCFRCGVRRRWFEKTASSGSSSTSRGGRGTSRKLWRWRRWDGTKMKKKRNKIKCLFSPCVRLFQCQRSSSILSIKEYNDVVYMFSTWLKVNCSWVMNFDWRHELVNLSNRNKPASRVKYVVCCRIVSH